MKKTLLFFALCSMLRPSGLWAAAPTATFTPVCVPTPIVLLDSGVGDSAVSLVEDPTTPEGVPPTAAVTTTVGSPTGWFPPCGSSKTIGYTTLGASPEASTPYSYTYTRSFTVPAAMLAPGAGVFTIAYKADDNGAVTINGAQIDVCDGHDVGDCFAPGCRTATIPSSSLSATSTLVMGITDTGIGSTCFCYEIFFTPASCSFTLVTGLPTDTPTVTPTPTITGTPTITFTPTSTFTPTLTPVDVYKMNKNIFDPVVDKNLTITVETNDFPGEYSLRIFNTAGEHIKDLDARYLKAPIAKTYLWDGTNKYGDACASGVYLFYLIEPTSRKLKRVILIH